MKKAEGQGIQKAKLLIANYLNMSSSQVLLLKFLETRNWKDSFFQVIPQRKRCQADSEEPQKVKGEEIERESEEKIPLGEFVDFIQLQIGLSRKNPILIVFFKNTKPPTGALMSSAAGAAAAGYAAAGAEESDSNSSDDNDGDDGINVIGVDGDDDISSTAMMMEVEAMNQLAVVEGFQFTEIHITILIWYKNLIWCN